MTVAGLFLKKRGGWVDQLVMTAPRHDRLALRSSRFSGGCLAILVLVTSTGCLALGVPSKRLHDPVDQGGILGDWKANPARTPATMTAELVAEGGVVVPAYEGCQANSAAIPGSLDLPAGMSAMELETHCGAHSKADKPPEVPWPRYHPVPTRPVFGSSGY